MKLYYTKRSPYACKVRAVAHEKGIDLELVEIADLQNKPAELLAANPLGKIPALELDDGTSIADSPVICEYLDSLNEKLVLIPRSGRKRFEVLTYEAIADGIMDATVSIVLENMRPEEKRFEVHIERQRGAVNRALVFFNEHIDLRDSEVTIAQLALASALSYMNFRLPDFGWQGKYSKLASWYEDIAKRPSIRDTFPKV